MNIAFFEINNWEKEHLSNSFKGHKLHFYPVKLDISTAHYARHCEIISTFIYSDINKNLLDLLPNLKLIVTRSTGFDHISLEECKKRKITVCNVPTYGENTVAEHTFALILDISRKIHKAFVRTVRDDFSIVGLKGFDLKGKTLGVIGAGHIGKHVIRIAKGFEMNVLVSDNSKNKKLAKKLGFAYSALPDLLKKSDIITLHVPLTEKTLHLINKNSIKLMKKGSILINTSRGEVVETEALLDSLNSNHLAGAGLDVIEGENYLREEKELLHNMHNIRGKIMRQVIEDHMLLHNDKVIFTPHIAFYSDEALKRILDCTIKNIQGFIKNKPQCIICK